MDLLGAGKLRNWEVFLWNWEVLFEKLRDFIKEWGGLLRNGEVYRICQVRGVRKIGTTEGAEHPEQLPKPGSGTHLSWAPPPPHPAPLALENNDPKVGNPLGTPFSGFCGCPLEHPWAFHRGVLPARLAHSQKSEQEKPQLRGTSLFLAQLPPGDGSLDPPNLGIPSWPFRPSRTHRSFPPPAAIPRGKNCHPRAGGKEKSLEKGSFPRVCGRQWESRSKIHGKRSFLRVAELLPQPFQELFREQIPLWCKRHSIKM